GPSSPAMRLDVVTPAAHRASPTCLTRDGSAAREEAKAMSESAAAACRASQRLPAASPESTSSRLHLFADLVNHRLRIRVRNLGVASQKVVELRVPANDHLDPGRLVRVERVHLERARYLRSGCAVDLVHQDHVRRLQTDVVVLNPRGAPAPIELEIQDDSAIGQM